MKSKGLKNTESLWTGILLALTTVMFISQLIVSPNIVSSFASLYDYIMKLVMSVISIGLVAAAVTLVMITAKLDLSVGSTMTIATIVSCNISSQAFYDTNPGLTIAFAIIAPIAVGLACGAINGFLVGTLQLNQFISTLGTMYIYQALAIAYNGGAYENGRSSDQLYSFLGRGSIGPVPVPIILIILVFFIFWFILHRTKFGRHVYAVGGNPTAARFAGINSSKVVFMTYLLAGLMAGIAGLFLASWTMNANMSVGKAKEFEVITAIILGGVSLTGGKGRMAGTMLGVLFMGVLRMLYVQFAINPVYQWLVQGVIILLVVYLNQRVTDAAAKGRIGGKASE